MCIRDSKNVECTVPPYDKYTDVTFKLLFFDYYEVNNTELHFTYKSLDIIDAVSPTQGHTSGGNIVTITGNFQILDGQTFQLFFGDFECTNFTMDSLYQITAQTPAATTAQIVLIKIVHNGETYLSESVIFSYKDYFQIISVSPTQGPSRGGTVVQITYNGTIGQIIYCKFGNQLSIPIIGKFRE